MKCTLARSMVWNSADTTMPPSILASSASRGAVKPVSRSRKPPLQTLSTGGPEPNITRAPVPCRTMRSTASRNGVPGANLRRMSRDEFSPFISRRGY